MFLAYFCTPKNKWDDSVAQLVEQYTFNVWALGSSPSGITKPSVKNLVVFLCLLYTFYILKSYTNIMLEPVLILTGGYTNIILVIQNLPV